ncbi:hypothetical protein [Streptomyces sp. NPDC049944]|uniref:hypothetical protein n=1 Tax=Streptomyces sp. NPDC049944 TaxID=3155657 RepID=UPI00341BD5BC
MKADKVADGSGAGPGAREHGSRTPATTGSASLSAQAREAVLQRIVDRRYAQGARLVEREVAEELARTHGRTDPRYPHGRAPPVPALRLGPLAADLGYLDDLDIALTTVAPSDSLVLPIALLREHGVRVGLGSDGVRDAWSPVGNADMLHRAHPPGWVTDVRLDDELTECYRVAAHRVTTSWESHTRTSHPTPCRLRPRTGRMPSSGRPPFPPPRAGHRTEAAHGPELP